MLTFLVFRTLYVATLQRSLVLLPCVHEGVGWGGVGGDVNVPGTSYGICSYAAEISGVVATLQRCLVLLLRGVHEGMGVGMLTFLLLRTLYVATLQRSLVLMLRCVHGGLGSGGVGGHCNVPGISYVIMCLRC